MINETLAKINGRINLASDAELYTQACQTAQQWAEDLPLDIRRKGFFILDGMWYAALNSAQMEEDHLVLFLKNRRDQAHVRHDQDSFSFYKMEEDFNMMERSVYEKSGIYGTSGLGGFQFLRLMQFSELLPKICEGFELSEEERESVRLKLQQEFMQHFLAELRLLITKVAESRFRRPT